MQPSKTPSLWDYSYHDAATGLYLVYRSKHPPVADVGPRTQMFMAVQDVVFHVPHDVIYVGLSPVPIGVIVPNQLPPPPRGWSENYDQEPMAHRGILWALKKILFG